MVVRRKARPNYDKKGGFVLRDFVNLLKHYRYKNSADTVLIG